MQPFLALITPLVDVGGGGGGGSPPGIWGPSDPRPTNPIAGWNPGTGQFPPSGPPPYPSHPIYYPGARPDNSLPGNQPYPDQGLPGNQPYPDQGLPGSQPRPDNSLPGSQPRPEHGLPPFPTHLPVVPPGGQWPSPPKPPGAPINLPAQNPEGGWVYAFVPGYGWMWLETKPPEGGGGGGGEQPPGATTKPGGDKPPIPVQPPSTGEPQKK